MCLQPSHFCHTHKSVTLEKSLVLLGKLGKLVLSTVSVTPKNWTDGSHPIRKKRKGDKSCSRLSPFLACVFISLFTFFVLFCFAVLFWGFGFLFDCFIVVNHLGYNWQDFPWQEGGLNQLSGLTGKEKQMANSYYGRNDWNQIFLESSFWWRVRRGVKRF